MLKVDLEKRLGELTIKAGLKLEGEGILALFGPSGAGKTSIINMIAGLMSPDQGLISIAGARVFDSQNRVNVPPFKRRIGYIFQEDRLFPHLSVAGNLNYGRKRLLSRKRSVGFEDAVRVLGIEHLLKRRPHNLSGGEKQRVAIGRALLTNPRLLLMDEPLNSVDESRKQDILGLIASIPGRFHIPVLYVSHAPEELEALSARVVRIHNGVTQD